MEKMIQFTTAQTETDNIKEEKEKKKLEYRSTLDLHTFLIIPYKILKSVTVTRINFKPTYNSAIFRFTCI